MLKQPRNNPEVFVTPLPVVHIWFMLEVYDFHLWYGPPGILVWVDPVNLYTCDHPIWPAPFDTKPKFIFGVVLENEFILFKMQFTIVQKYLLKARFLKLSRAAVVRFFSVFFCWKNWCFLIGFFFRIFFINCFQISQIKHENFSKIRKFYVFFLISQIKHRKIFKKSKNLRFFWFRK